MKQHSWRRCRRKFRRRYPDAPVPDRTTICRLFKKFNETGSVANKKPRVNKRVLTEEKLDEIAFRLEISPRKSLRRLANNPHTLDELQENIRQEIRNISRDELLKVSANVLKRCEACLNAGGHHFQHLQQ
ncbi:hypothetical protein C0J52_21882 [Blattella germanica]|nr:hypothetical protein C0J52_21882 [Blattella germanica]